jgi:predicted metal-dependent enzyme (double-stranded beta helix superfamily)
MTQTQEYTVERFVEDVQRIMNSGKDRAAIVEQVTPLVDRVMKRDDLLDDKYKVVGEDGRYSYVYHRSDDESLSIHSAVFLPGRPTPVHDHITWGVIGVYSGQQQTTRYRRMDDGSQSGKADLEVIADDVYGRGMVYPLLPPDDIHRIEALGDEPGVSLHVLGMDPRTLKRHIFRPEQGTVEDWEGGSMRR